MTDQSKTRCRALRPVTAVRLAALGLPFLAPPAAVAQTEAEGGVSAVLGISERLEYVDGDGLTTGSGTLSSLTSVDIELASATRNSRASLEAGTGLRVAAGPDATETDFPADTRIALAYSRFSRSTLLDLEARLRQDDIGFLRPLEVTVAPDGTLILPSDLNDLEGSGTRREIDLEASLALWRDQRLSVILDASATDLSYQDVTSPNLDDSLRTDVGITALLALTEEAQANLSLRRSRYDEEGSEPRETTTLSGDLIFDQPLGSLTFGASVSDTPEGTRYGADVGRVWQFAASSVSATIGAVRTANDEVELTGEIAGTRSLPLGEISASLSRSVSSTADDSELLYTVLAAQFERELTPISSIAFDGSWIRSEDTGSGATVDNASFGVGYARDLTEDWTLGAGYRHDWRDASDGGNENSDSVYVEVRREFDLRR